MTPKEIEKANELLNELKEMEDIERLLKVANTTHFEACEHYAPERATRKTIPHRYNDRILNVVKEIISEIKSEIEKL